MKSLVSHASLRLRIFIALYVSILTILIMYTRIITGSPVPTKDSGVFLYIGEAMLHGKVPYVNIWDNKPPLIYFIDAFGLWLGHNTIWGVIALETVSTAVSLTLAILLLSRIFTTRIAILGVSNMAALFVLLIPGNMTEEYGFCLMILALFCFYSVEIGKKSLWRYALIGLSSSLLFLLKPTFIGIPLSIGVVLLVRNRHHVRLLAQKLFLLLAGVLFPLILAIIYLVTRHAFSAFLYQVIYLNRVSSQYAPFGLRESFIIGLSSTASMSLLAFTGYLVACIRWKHIQKEWKRYLLLSVALIDLPLEIIFSGLPGRAYSHYYVPWLPSLLILSCFLFSSMFELIHAVARIKERYVREIVTAVDLLSVVFLSLLVFPLHDFSQTYAYYKPANLAYAQAVDFIDTHTKPTDYVLLWGQGIPINYAAHRQSPTRFTYQTNLFTPQMVDLLYKDLKHHPPLYIIDTSPTNPAIPSLNPGQRNNFTEPSVAGFLPAIQKVLNWIDANYIPTQSIGPQRWQIYRRSPTREQSFANDRSSTSP
jgi:hypothetical protein